MKNITLSAQDETIDALKQVARQKGTTVNDLFRNWTNTYLKQERAERLKKLEESFKLASYVKLDRKYTREEMNER